jgi:hypothetical protein
MVKKDEVKKTEKGDIVTRFWHTLKKLNPMASPFSPECSSKGSKDSRNFATNDGEHNGLETWQGSGSETWQGDGVERWQVVEDESESQDTFQWVQPWFGNI